MKAQVEEPRYYSRDAKTNATQSRRLPHWSQRCATFVTFRLADSLPAGKLTSFREERAEWIGLHPEPWDDVIRAEYEDLFPERFQKWLDAGFGSCCLKDSEYRRVVEDALCHFDGTRYSLYAYVVMPNHVHVLFQARDGYDGAKVVQSWKSFTANVINKMLGLTGAFWQKESYDHLVRSVEEFNRIRSYIRANAPDKTYDVYCEP